MPLIKSFSGSGHCARSTSLCQRISSWLNVRDEYEEQLQLHGFLNSEGVARISRDELQSTFDEEGSVFIMDYHDARTNFDVRVTARVLNNSDLRAAMEAFELFRDKVTYPVDYEENLRAAVERGQNPDDYRMEIDVN